MNSLEAKVVILGAQGAGKTSLVVRFVENNFHRNLQSTIGASFLVKKVYTLLIQQKIIDRQVDDCVVRLQVCRCYYFCVDVDLGYSRTRTVSIDGLVYDVDIADRGFRRRCTIVVLTRR